MLMGDESISIFYLFLSDDISDDIDINMFCAAEIDNYE